MSQLTIVILLVFTGMFLLFGFMVVRGIINERKEKQNKEIKNEQK